MLFLKKVTYDSATRLLTARFAEVSTPGWESYEFRDVSPQIAQRLTEAQPHGGQFIRTQIAPFHQRRRAGMPDWRLPSATPSNPTQV